MVDVCVILSWYSWSVHATGKGKVTVRGKILSPAGEYFDYYISTVGVCGVILSHDY